VIEGYSTRRTERKRRPSHKAARRRERKKRPTHKAAARGWRLSKKGKQQKGFLVPRPKKPHPAG